MAPLPSTLLPPMLCSSPPTTRCPPTRTTHWSPTFPPTISPSPRCTTPMRPPTPPAGRPMGRPPSPPGAEPTTPRRQATTSCSTPPPPTTGAWRSENEEEEGVIVVQVDMTIVLEVWPRPPPFPTQQQSPPQPLCPTWRGSTWPTRTRTWGYGLSNMFLSSTLSTAAFRGGRRKWGKCESQKNNVLH